MVKAVSDFGVVIGMIGAALAAGIPVTTRIYQPPSAAVRVFEAISNVAALVACVGAALVLIAFLTTGTGPG
jgi:hypothetical protein